MVRECYTKRGRYERTMLGLEISILLHTMAGHHTRSDVVGANISSSVVYVSSRYAEVVVLAVSAVGARFAAD